MGTHGQTLNQVAGSNSACCFLSVKTFSSSIILCFLRKTVYFSWIGVWWPGRAVRADKEGLGSSTKTKRWQPLEQFPLPMHKVKMLTFLCNLMLVFTHKNRSGKNKGANLLLGILGAQLHFLDLVRGLRLFWGRGTEKRGSKLCGYSPTLFMLWKDLGMPEQDFISGSWPVEHDCG